VGGSRGVEKRGRGVNKDEERGKPEGVSRKKK